MLQTPNTVRKMLR